MKDVDRATCGTSRVFNTGTSKSPSTSGLESMSIWEVNQQSTFGSCPRTGDLVEDGFSEDTPFTATFPANVLCQHSEGITLEGKIVFLCEYSECDWSEVGQLDLDGEEGGR